MEAQRPSIGRIVIYRSRTGAYDVPAIINCTVDSLNPAGVEAGHIPSLSSETHVHLTVFTPGKPGLRQTAEDFQVTTTATFGDQPAPRSENVAGCYQEWDIPFHDESYQNRMGEAHPQPGTWRWPERV